MIQPNHFLDKFPERLRDQDYSFLRARSLDFLRKLGTAHWTDHNVHDPGVTLAEMLCYVLSDLGARIDADVKDILAEKHPLDREMEKPFRSPREILPGHPITGDDFRKVLLDVPGVRNGWLELVEDPQPPLYLDCKRKALTYEAKPHFGAIKLQGLYDVLLELEPDPELGDMNLWRYAFPLRVSGKDGEVVLRFSPAWGDFLAAGRRPGDFRHLSLGPLVSAPGTNFYSGSLSLAAAGIAGLELPFNLFSRFPKDGAHQRQLRHALEKSLPDLFAFLSRRIHKGLETAAAVLRRLHADRSLCEDFRRVKPIGVEEVGVCADVEIRADADPETVAAEIEYALELFLSPRICFYSLGEMQEQRFTLDEIFAGPRLRHGFLRDADLAATRLPECASEIRRVHASDLIHAIMDVEGVAAVRNLQLSQFFQGKALVQGEPWSLAVGRGRTVRFTAEGSKFVFYKGLIPYSAKKSVIREKLREMRARERHIRLAQCKYDAPVPLGVHRGLAEYRSLQRDFPLVYGIGEEGLSPDATAKRKAQAKQLKAYLLVFEQVLADTWAQLGRIRDLFSLNPGIRKTYFSQPLEALPITYQFTAAARESMRLKKVPDWVLAALEPLASEPAMEADKFKGQITSLVGDLVFPGRRKAVFSACEIPGIPGAGVPRIFGLIKEFVEKVSPVSGPSGSNPDLSENAADRFESVEKEWRKFLLERKHGRVAPLERKRGWVESFFEREEILESQATFEDRRNRFLDHLLARFGEQFTDYVLLSAELEGAKSPERLIEDKLGFLADYPALGYERGKAFNYRGRGKIWHTGNVSGLEKRVARLAGFKSYHRRNLAGCGIDEFEIYQEKDADGIDEYRFRLPGGPSGPLLSSTKHYHGKEELLEELQWVLEKGKDKKHYAILSTTNNRWYFNFLDSKGGIIAMRKEYFKTSDEAAAAMEETAARLQAIHDACGGFEGLHLVEHILLRPARAGDKLFTVCTEGDCGCCPGESDPYSFRVTALVPAWTLRSRNLDFRRFFEETLRREAPAHVHVKVCWLSRDHMDLFEGKYKKWLRQMADPAVAGEALARSRKELIAAMEKVRSVYPETRLHDCESETGEKVLLNLSRLGTIKGEIP